MLQVLHAIRTNNVRKIPNYNPLLLQHMKKLLRGLAHSPQQGTICHNYYYNHFFLLVLNEENQLKLTLNDLLNCDSQGRSLVLTRYIAKIYIRSMVDSRIFMDWPV